MKKNSIPRPRSEFQLQEFDSELVLYDPEQKKVIYLSESAALIWRLCDGQRTIEEIVQLLQDAYPDKTSEILNDVERAMACFMENNVIVWM